MLRDIVPFHAVAPKLDDEGILLGRPPALLFRHGLGRVGTLVVMMTPGTPLTGAIAAGIIALHLHAVAAVAGDASAADRYDCSRPRGPTVIVIVSGSVSDRRGEGVVELPLRGGLLGGSGCRGSRIGVGRLGRGEVGLHS